MQVIDPVSGGFVGTLAHPGGNATGFMTIEYGISGKWLELPRLNVGKRELSARLGLRGLGIAGRRVTAGLRVAGLSVTHKFADRRGADHAPALDAISLLVFTMLVVALIAWLFR